MGAVRTVGDPRRLTNSGLAPLTILRALLPGVRLVHEQIEPYAEAWSQANTREARQSGPLWVVLGDSLSQGIGASAYDRGWVGQARARLDALGRRYRLLNLSTAGATSADVLATQLPSLGGISSSPALVTLLVGGNDVIRPSTRATLPEHFRRILSQLPPGSLVARMPQPLAVSRAVNVLIDTDPAAVPVDVRRAVARVLGHRAPDLFHPNDRGYARVASTFVEAAMRVEYP
jgi:lysophospholipase L1-like esterase